MMNNADNMVRVTMREKRMSLLCFKWRNRYRPPYRSKKFLPAFRILHFRFNTYPNLRIQIRIWSRWQQGYKLDLRLLYYGNLLLVIFNRVADRGQVSESQIGTYSESEMTICNRSEDPDRGKLIWNREDHTADFHTQNYVSHTWHLYDAYVYFSFCLQNLTTGHRYANIEMTFF